MMRNEWWSGVAGTFCIVKIPVIIHLESHREFVKVLSHLVIGIERFMVVHFAVTVQVLQPDPVEFGLYTESAA